MTIETSKTITRIITCQGTIQLLTALSVLSYRQREQDQFGLLDRNYLVIYDLFAPSGQIEAFVEFIEKMARSVCDWVQIVYLDPETLKTIEQQMKSTSPKTVFGRLRSRIGIDQADEIYLCRNWQFGNQLLMNAYASAYKICYGDGIGIYFSETSAVIRTATISQAKPAPKKLSFYAYGRFQAAVLWHRFQVKYQLKTILQSIKFDIGYFVLPNSFGETPPMPVVQLQPSVMRATFERFIHLVPLEDLEQFRAAIADAPVSILLTSNLSEAQRLPQDLEIQAYREFLLSQGVPSGSVLVIKPHPRDDLEKLDRLQAACSDLFDRVIVLSNSNLFFLPFEVFFIAAFRPSVSLSKPRVFAVSSACLSLKLLFDVPSFIGFGESLTSRIFYETHLAARLEHEQILETALQSLNINYSNPKSIVNS